MESITRNGNAVEKLLLASLRFNLELEFEITWHANKVGLIRLTHGLHEEINVKGGERRGLNHELVRLLRISAVGRSIFNARTSTCRCGERDNVHVVHVKFEFAADLKHVTAMRACHYNALVECALGIECLGCAAHHEHALNVLVVLLQHGLNHRCEKKRVSV
jgi:hypothetical protein